MYCPNCGAESTFGLNYCKHCGGNLSDITQPATAPTKNVLAALILAAATLGIVLGGLGIVFSAALSLIGPQSPGFAPPVHDSVVVAGLMVVLGSATIGLVSLMLIKLFSRMMGFGSTADKPSRPARTFVPEQRVPQIQAQPISVQSVTEHTTRNFEPRVRRRDTNE
jgi:hypothetical protein